MPSWLSFDAGTRTFSGTPLEAHIGTVSVTVTASNGTDSVNDTFDITVADNLAPTAQAGADRTVNPGATVTLNGSGSSDSDGTVESYAWSQVSGTSVTLQNENTARATFTAPEAAGELVFRLTVTDDTGATGTDDVTVTVRDAPPSFASGMGALRLEPGAAMEPVVLPAATGGNGSPYTYALTSSPEGLAGLRFDAGTRTLSGTPDEEKGRWTFTYMAHDGDANTAESDAARLTFRVTVGVAFEEQQQVITRTLAAVASRTVASALGNIGARLGGGVPGASLTLAGETVPLGTSGTGLAEAGPDCAPGRHDPASALRQPGDAERDGCAPVARSRGVDTDALWRTSAFSLTLGAAEGETGFDPAAPQWGVWGRGDFGSFEGRPDAISSYRGDTRSGWLGLDARAERWVAGLAVSRGWSETDYVLEGDKGRIETDLTALYPYGRWTFADGLELRGMLGAGRGEVRHAADDGTRETSRLTMWMGSLGVRQPLPPVAGIDLAAQGDASLARMETAQGAEAVDGLTADSWRARLGLEASRRMALGDASAVTPFVEASGRRDGGDGLTGSGLEVAGGVRWEAPRVHVEARGRWLAVHSEEGVEERGLSITARVGPGAHGRGLSLALSPRWGAGAGAAKALWRDDLPKTAGSADEAASVDARIGYGLDLAPHGLLTPFAETDLAGGDERRMRLGTRYEAWQGALGVELAGERVESTAGPEHALRLDLGYRHGAFGVGLAGERIEGAAGPVHTLRLDLGLRF